MLQVLKVNLPALGMHVRKCRWAAKLTQRQLTNYACVAAGDLAKIESGCDDFDLVSLQKVCLVLDLDIVYLLGLLDVPLLQIMDSQYIAFLNRMARDRAVIMWRQEKTRVAFRSARARRDALVAERNSLLLRARSSFGHLSQSSLVRTDISQFAVASGS